MQTNELLLDGELSADNEESTIDADCRDRCQRTVDVGQMTNDAAASLTKTLTYETVTTAAWYSVSDIRCRLHQITQKTTQLTTVRTVIWCLRHCMCVMDSPALRTQRAVCTVNLWSHSLRRRTGLTSIWIFCHILLPCLWYNFAQNVNQLICSCMVHNDYLPMLNFTKIRSVFVPCKKVRCCHGSVRQWNTLHCSVCLCHAQLHEQRNESFSAGLTISLPSNIWVALVGHLQHCHQNTGCSVWDRTLSMCKIPAKPFSSFTADTS